MHRTSVAYWNWRNQIRYSGAGEGGGGGGGAEGRQQEQQTQAAGEGDDTLEGGESDDDDEINVDPAEALRKLFTVPKSGDEEEEDDEDDDSDEILTEEQVSEILTEGLKKVTVPADFIPENFDPSDPKQMRELLNKTLQLGAKHSLNLMFRPVENAMKAHAKAVKQDVRTRLKDASGQNTETTLLDRELPAHNNPVNRDVVNAMWKQAKTQHPKDSMKAIKMVRASLKAMNIDPDDAGRTRKKSGEGGGELLTGADALDRMAPLPKKGATAANLRR